ncbi:MYB4R1 [Mycena crocata]|nr:MYB4R1 [Mycena crocata]
MNQPTPKELALRALNSNQSHQYAVAQHAEKLAAELAELDKLLLQADIEDGDSDLECDFYIPDAKPAAGLIRNFNNPESPFFEDTMKRTRYINFTVRHTMPPKEVEALKVAVNAELRRVEKSEGMSSATTDSQMANKLDWTVIAEKVSDSSTTTRTAEECKIKWIAELSTAVNRGDWSPVELQNLQNILISAPNQTTVDWVEVARKLGTNRLPLDCMRHGLERPRHSWTADSDQKVLDAVRQYGTTWSLVAKYVSPEVAPAQCSTRFLRTLDPSLRRGGWSVEEDKRLCAAVMGYGKVWTEVANVVPGRTSEQCRDRWTGTLDPSKNEKKDGWPEEDEKALIKAVKAMGNKWKAIGIQLGRSATVCRLHYDKLKQQEGSPVAGPSSLPVMPEEDDDTGTPSGRSTPARKTQSQATVDPLTQKSATPRPKALAKGKSPGAGKKRVAPGPEDTNPRKKRAIETAPEVIPAPPAHNPPTVSTASPDVKVKRRILQVSTLPRRRSARLKGGELQGSEPDTT